VNSPNFFAELKRRNAEAGLRYTTLNSIEIGGFVLTMRSDHTYFLASFRVFYL
jgi:hypothetical protein